MMTLVGNRLKWLFGLLFAGGELQSGVSHLLALSSQITNGLEVELVSVDVLFDAS
jgi:hypothetical protein